MSFQYLQSFPPVSASTNPQVPSALAAESGRFEEHPSQSPQQVRNKETVLSVATSISKVIQSIVLPIAPHQSQSYELFEYPRESRIERRPYTPEPRRADKQVGPGPIQRSKSVPIDSSRLAATIQKKSTTLEPCPSISSIASSYLLPVDECASPQNNGKELKQSKTDITFVKRQPPGLMGRSFCLISNFVEVRLPRGLIYVYSVQIFVKGKNSEEEEEWRLMRTRSHRSITRKIIDTFINQYGAQFEGCTAVFDGWSSLLFRQIPPFMSRKFENVKHKHLNGYFRDYMVEITYESSIPLDEIHQIYNWSDTPVDVDKALCAVGDIIRKRQLLTEVQLGKCFYFPPIGNKHDRQIGYGAEIWYGYYSSLSLGIWKPLVNVDIVATTFYTPGPLLDFIRQILNVNSVHEIGRQTFEKNRYAITNEIHLLRVKATHLSSKRVYRIEGLSEDSAIKSTFNWRDRNVTVVQYYYEKYNIMLRYPHLPMVLVGTTKDMLPFEFCEIIPGQHYKKQLNTLQCTNYLKATECFPRERFLQIRAAVRSLKSCSKEYSKAFDINFNETLMQVPGRAIDPPKIKCGDNHVETVKEGSWSCKKFIRAASLEKWAMAIMGSVQSIILDRMVDMLKKEGAEMGMRICDPVGIIHYGLNTGPREMLEHLRKTYPDLQMTICMLGRTTDYRLLKAEAETTDLCMQTQCIREANVIKFNRSLAINFLHKINAKIGGQNIGIEAPLPHSLSKPYMAIGICIVFASFGELQMPTVVAVVASMDNSVSKYHAITSVQMRVSNSLAVKHVIKLESMIVECLKAFVRNNNVLPFHLLVFRCGAPNGKADEAVIYEFGAIRAACSSVSPDYVPSMTFILLHNKHRARFIPKYAKDECGPKKNIPPGTVVDCRVVNPINFDFYLCSHRSLQGTSRPTHYQVVHDDLSHSPDEIYNICYCLCHTSARCSKSLTVPAPVHYANLAACRAKTHIRARIENVPTAIKGSGQASDELDLEKLNRQQAVAEFLRSEMYFI